MNTRTMVIDPKAPDLKLLAEAGSVLRAGGLVAFPTETVYGLGGNALDPEASRKIYAAKGRPSDNPLIVHIAAREELDPLVADVPEIAEKLMEAFWPGPMTLIFRKSSRVPKETTGGLDTVAVRMPSDPIAAELIRQARVPIAAPSANTSGRPSPTTAAHVQEDLSGKIEVIIDGGPVGIGLESTIIDCTGDEAVILRPGYISREMITGLLGSVSVDKASTEKPEPGMHPKAPGMKYRHYAPKAQLTVYRGDARKVAEVISSQAAEAEAAGKTAVVIATEENQALYTAGRLFCVGARADEETIAHNLYAVLRRCDDEKVDVIFSECFDEQGLGMAIMNRLRKAAGYRIEDV